MPALVVAGKLRQLGRAAYGDGNEDPALDCRWIVGDSVAGDTDRVVAPERSPGDALSTISAEAGSDLGSDYRHRNAAEVARRIEKREAIAGQERLAGVGGIDECRRYRAGDDRKRSVAKDGDQDC